MEMDDDALNRLRAYSWPGNVRELKNVLERAVLLGDQKKLRTRDLDFDAPIKAEDLSGGRVRTLEEMERHYVTQVLETSGGRVAEAALKLGIPRSTLYHKLKEYRARELASEPEPHRERLSS
jgi:DNA-binding NtrC family response regulator